MSEAYDLVQALNRNTQELRELRDETKRLREEFEKLHASVPEKKDRAETVLEGLVPLAASLISGKRRRPR